MLCMTMFATNPNMFKLDHKIERTLHFFRKSRRMLFDPNLFVDKYIDFSQSDSVVHNLILLKWITITKH